MKAPMFINKSTGELVTYEQAKQEFYKINRTWKESIFDEYEETDILSDETLEKPNFILTVRKAVALWIISS